MYSTGTQFNMALSDARQRQINTAADTAEYIKDMLTSWCGVSEVKLIQVSHGKKVKLKVEVDNE